LNIAPVDSTSNEELNQPPLSLPPDDPEQSVQEPLPVQAGSFAPASAKEQSPPESVPDDAAEDSEPEILCASDEDHCDILTPDPATRKKAVQRSERSVKNPAKASDKVSWTDCKVVQHAHQMFIERPDGSQVPLCGELTVIGLGRNATGDNWGKYVEWKDRDGEEHEAFFSDEELVSRQAAVLKALTRGGLPLYYFQKDAAPLLCRHLYNSGKETERRIVTVTSLGWYKQSFVTGDGIISGAKSNEEIRYLSGGTQAPNFRQKGTFSGWIENVSVWAGFSSIIGITLSIAFYAPIAKLLKSRPETGGVHIWGQSSLGKSISGEVAASLYGYPFEDENGKKLTWKNTAAAMEHIAAAHNDTLLFLDESKLAKQNLKECIYLLSGGATSGKSRAAGSLRKRSNFTVSYVSTGELSTDTQSRLFTGERIDAGANVRCINIRADQGVPESEDSATTLGIFHSLPRGVTKREAFGLVKKALNEHHGFVGASWIEWLSTRQNEIDELMRPHLEEFDRRVEELPVSSDQRERVKMKFRHWAAAGELATAMGFTGWRQGTAIDACLLGLKEWEASCPGESHETNQIVERAVQFTQELHKFAFPKKGTRIGGIIYGYRNWEDDEDGILRRKPRLIHVLDRVFEQIAGNSGAATAFEKLNSLGIMERSGRRKKYQVRRLGIDGWYYTIRFDRLQEVAAALTHD
jgi:hypothetical protein